MGGSVETHEKLDSLLDSLDNLKTELMLVITQSRSEREISEKILNISMKYRDIPEVFELIMFLNGILSLDIKSMKESIIKSIDTLIMIKKASIKRMIDLDHRVLKIEETIQDLNEQYENHIKEDEDDEKDEKEDSEENVIKIFGAKINILKVAVIVLSAFIILFIAYSINEKAASKAVSAISTTTEKVIQEKKADDGEK
jgi:hypothetical protein